ncbi:MAG: HAMP domain-containing histidine kinase, partial [Epsilonproteobacteria bacterium]|nr:HAMP domain-containing histidine kinase [Campylobacterota bacterium]
KDIEKIRENLNQIERFVKDVLNLHLITSFNLDIKEFRVSTLIAQALNKSNILNEDSIVVEMEEDFLIKGDLEYLSIALKNLIQNGLDYTTSFPIKIEVKENIVRVISSGDELKEGLEFYIKPFAKGSTKGFGLGLSLTKLILEKHNFDLIYSYNNGKNIFGIVVKK